MLFVLAWLPLLVFGEDIIINTKKKLMWGSLEADEITVNANLVTINTLLVHVIRGMKNGALVLFDSALPALISGCTEYVIGGFLVNNGLFVVRYNSPTSPISTRFLGSPDTRLVNTGAMVFLIHKPVSEAQDVQIFTLLSFENSGFISILGSKASIARLELQACFQTVQRGDRIAQEEQGMFVNLGVIFVKHAVVTQHTSMKDEGCIAIGEGGSFIANSAFLTEQQVFYFLPGTALPTLIILTHFVPGVATYVVLNFPKEAKIVVGQDYKAMHVSEAGSVSFFALPAAAKTLTIYFGPAMERSKFRFRDGVLTYADDIPLDKAPSVCGSVGRVQEIAEKFEIKD